MFTVFSPNAITGEQEGGGSDDVSQDNALPETVEPVHNDNNGEKHILRID